MGNFDFGTKPETPSSKLLTASDIFSPSPKFHNNSKAAAAGASRFAHTPHRNVLQGVSFPVESFAWALETPSALSAGLQLSADPSLASGSHPTGDDDLLRHLMVSPLTLVRRSDHPARCLLPRAGNAAVCTGQF